KAPSKRLHLELGSDHKRISRGLSWLTTEGGPILVGPRATAAAWRGKRDYPQVMDLTSPSVIRFRGGELLVLPLPLPTAWIAELALLVRADQGSASQRVVVAEASRDVAWRSIGLLDSGRSGELVYFDAAADGKRATYRMRVLPGKCRVEVAGPLRAQVPDPGADEDELTVK